LRPLGGDGRQRARDVGEVLAHRLLRLGAVLRRDRRHDSPVLGERFRRPAGREHGAELEADEVRVQAGADVVRDHVPGDLQDAPAQDGVALGDRPWPRRRIAPRTAPRLINNL
jgi:hypothetical protein